LSGQEVMVDPVDMAIDGFEAAAGSVVLLRQMFVQHPRAESRFVPGDVVPLRPGYGCRGALHDVQ
jgi:hypothetical protein